MESSISHTDACNRILRMLSLSGIATSEQCARLTYRHAKYPLERVRPVIRYLRDEGYIETLQTSKGAVGIHRLSLSVRKPNGISAVRWDTLLQHKLAVTDVYVAIHANQCPRQWIREYRQIVRLPNGHAFSPEPDVFTYINGMPYFIEVQRTSIETRKWTRKRQLYELYFHQNAWIDAMQQKPIVVVIQHENQQSSTIGNGIGYELIVIKSVGEILRTSTLSTVCLS